MAFCKILLISVILSHLQVILSAKVVKTTYRVFIHTGDVDQAGTKGNAYITLFGKDNDTGIFGLVYSKTNGLKFFQENAVDEFEIEAIDVGEIQKIKIGHDDPTDDWFLRKVDIYSLSLNMNFTFHYGNWIATNKNDKQLEKVLPYVENGTTYHVFVYTGISEHAETKGKVDINLIGKDKETGKINLEDSLTNRRKFRAYAVDEFVIETIDVGEPQKIKIGHDDTDDGWLLRKVDIHSPSLGKNWTFRYGNWIATNENDGALEKELTHLSHVVNGTTYHVFVHTGNKRGAGTSARVHIILFGKDKHTGVIALEDSLTNSEKFETATVDEFVIETIDVGELQKIRIGHDNTRSFAGWFLHKVVIYSPSLDKNWTFPSDRWFDDDEDDKKLERELILADACSWTPCKNKGTCLISDGNYTCHCTTGWFGDNCEIENFCSWKPCRNEGVCMNAPNTYTCQCLNPWTGPRCDINTNRLCFLQPCSNGGTCTDQQGTYVCTCTDEWTDVNCTTRNFCSPNPCKNEGVCMNKPDTYTCQCLNPWIGLNCNISVNDLCSVHPCQNGGTCTDKPGTYTCTCAVEWTGFNCTTNKHCSLNPCTNGGTCFQTTRHYFCDCSTQWTGFNCQTKAMAVFNVIVYTGNLFDAGTNANVYIQFFGMDNNTGKIYLVTPKRKVDTFERSLIDEFEVGVINIGELQKIKIGHDDSGDDSSWQLNKLELYSGNKKWTSVCNCWLRKLQGMGDLERELTPQPAVFEKKHCTPNPCQNEGVCFETTDHYTCQCQSGWTGLDCTIGESESYTYWILAGFGSGLCILLIFGCVIVILKKKLEGNRPISHTGAYMKQVEETSTSFEETHIHQPSDVKM